VRVCAEDHEADLFDRESWPIYLGELSQGDHHLLLHLMPASGLLLDLHSRGAEMSLFGQLLPLTNGNFGAG
jgi:hypothetical protein